MNISASWSATLSAPAAVKQRNRKLGTDEPTRSFTTRVSIRAANRFIAYCERERISYREAFDRLTEQLPDV